MNASAKPDLILLIDDEEANISLLERVLNRAGYHRIEKTTDSRRGMALATQIDPDLVLVDVNMPGLSGFDIIERLHTQPSDRRPAIIVLTADPSATLAAELLERGASAIVHKPFEFQELLREVDRLLTTRATPE
jgi:putative two-component system response regulator